MAYGAPGATALVHDHLAEVIHVGLDPPGTQTVFPGLSITADSYRTALGGNWPANRDTRLRFTHGLVAVELDEAADDQRHRPRSGCVLGGGVLRPQRQLHGTEPALLADFRPGRFTAGTTAALPASPRRPGDQ